LGSGADYGAVSQQITTVPGTTYLVTFEYSGNPDGGGNITDQVSLTWNGAIVGSDDFNTSNSSHTNMDWQSAQYYVVASGTTSTLGFTNTSAAIGATYAPVIDNVTMFVTQSPTAPVILNQPASQVIPAGGTAQFSVSATGAGPLAYQWWFNQTNSLAQATNSTLTLTNVTLAQAGNYTVVVTNEVGSVTSTPAALALDGPPTIASPGSLVSGTNAATGTRAVTLNATVNPNGLATTVVFQYGLTTSYVGSLTPANLPAGGVGINVSASIDAIAPGVVYHWAVTATNSLGGVSTPDQTFYTPSIYPPGVTNASGIVDQNELNAVLANYWPNSPWVTMTNVAGLGTVNVQFALTNANNWDFSVLVSTNLTDWQYIGPATPMYQFTDPQATNQAARYYRLQWP
jgi:hypothetical protein